WWHLLNQKKNRSPLCSLALLLNDYSCPFPITLGGIVTKKMFRFSLSSLALFLSDYSHALLTNDSKIRNRFALRSLPPLFLRDYTFPRPFPIILGGIVKQK